MDLILDFNTSTFHFIRPLFLWSLLPVFMLFILTLIKRKSKVKWKNSIAPHLWKYVILDQKSGYGLRQWFLLLFTLVLVIVAAAGPTWRKKEIPGMKTESVLLIGLDCSLSMLADDIQPNRLERAKLKLHDLLEADPGARIGLFAYSGTAHPVVPVCSDYKLLNHHLNSLSPGIMPVQGTNIELALNLAESMLERNSVPATILLISDGFSYEQEQDVYAFLEKSEHSIDILPIATKQGAKVPSYGRGQYFRDKNREFIISKPDINVLNRLKDNDRINVHTLTLDNSDVNNLATKIRENLDIKLDDTVSDEEWEDMGMYLLWPAAFFILLWFRRGWVIQFCIVFMLGWQACSPDSKNADWWYSADYIAQYHEEADSFSIAAETYESVNHKAVAYFKDGNYEAAASLFGMDSSANGYFNQALALANLGRYDESLELMQKAIELDASNPNSKELLSQIEKNKFELDSVSRQFREKKQLKEPETAKEELKTRRPKGEDEKLSDETEVEELPEHGNRVAEEVDTDIIQGEEMEKPMGEQEMPQKEVDASKVMLRKISSDPGEFLRRRFKLQREKYYPDVKETEVKW